MHEHTQTTQNVPERKRCDGKREREKQINREGEKKQTNNSDGELQLKYHIHTHSLYVHMDRKRFWGNGTKRVGAV